MIDIFINMLQAVWFVWSWFASPIIVTVIVYRILSGQSISKTWYKIRCFFGKPKIEYFYFETDSYFEICKHCHHRKEVH